MTAIKGSMKSSLNIIPKNHPKEFFETLARSDSLHIERIISKCHTSAVQTSFIRLPAMLFCAAI